MPFVATGTNYAQTYANELANAYPYYLYFHKLRSKANPFLIIIAALTVVTFVLLGVYNAEQSTILGLTWVAGTATVGCVFSAICFALHKAWRDLYMHCGEIYGEVQTK